MGRVISRGLTALSTDCAHAFLPGCRSMSADVLILGLGNPLMGDDGVGAAVVDFLLAAGIPRCVRAEAVSDVYALPAAWRDEPEVWVIDAMIRRTTPGTVHHLGHDQVLGLAHRASSAHHLDVAEGLRWITHAFPKMAEVRFRLWGVEPQRVGPREGLSEVVDRAARVVSREVLDALSESRRAACD